MNDRVGHSAGSTPFLSSPPQRPRTVESPPPDPTKIAERLALASVEVLNGHRSVRQLQKWLAPHIYMALAQRAGLASRIGKRVSLPARIMSSRMCFPAEHVCEATVVVWDVNRPRACALRLEIHRGRWRVNALDVI